MRSLLIALVVLVVSSTVSQAYQYIKPYYRKDGTAVSGHYRTAPDGNLYNNISYTW